MRFALALLLASSSLPARAAPPLGVPTPIVDPGHTGLQHWFSALKSAADHTGVARAIHYGDSTIAADGFASTVRNRLAARFGSAGPGFVSAALTPTWNWRSDVKSSRSGGWEWRTILLGGAGGRYGLGGIVGIVASGGKGALEAVDGAGASLPMHHAELWYQAGAGYGSYQVTADGREIGRGAAAAAQTEDRRFKLDLSEGFTRLGFGALGGTVPLYGAVLETGGPGITWEALGVIGVGSKSFTTYAKDALRPQVEQRDPDLVVVMLGGNEAGYPALLGHGGEAYAPIYDGALSTILAGAGDASCLVLTPLDQGFVDEVDGTEKARPGMPNLVAVQARVAAAHHCAFWSTWEAMGGAGSALTWAHRRGYGTGDLVHVTPAGLDRLGNLLADALLGDDESWASGR